MRESRSPNRRRHKPKSSTTDEPEEFILESIKGKRTSPQTGEIEYFIKWKGFPAATNTWETVSSISQWQNVIDAYEKETEESDTISSTTPAGASSPKPKTKRSRRGSDSSCSSTDSRSRSKTSAGPPSPKQRSKRSRRGSGSSSSSIDSRSRSPTSTTGPEASAPRKVAPPMGPPPPKKPSTPKKVPNKVVQAPGPSKAKKSSNPHTQYEIFGYKHDAYCYRIVLDEDEDSAQPSTSKGHFKRISTSHTPRGLLRKYSPIGLAESFEACVVSGDEENSISIPEFEQEIGTKHDEPPFNYTVADSVPDGLVPIRVLALIKYESQLVYYVEWRPLGEVDDEDGPDIQKSYTLVKGSALKKDFSEAIIKFYDTLLLMDNTWACVCGKQRNETDKSASNFKGKPVIFQLDRVLERSNVHDIESGRHTRGMELMYYTECPANAEVDKILNVYIHEELPCYVVKWKGESDAVLVRGSEFRKHHPQAVIGFFQSRIKWVKPRVD